MSSKATTSQMWSENDLVDGMVGLHFSDHESDADDDDLHHDPDELAQVREQGFVFGRPLT